MRREKLGHSSDQLSRLPRAFSKGNCMGGVVFFSCVAGDVFIWGDEYLWGGGLDNQKLVVRHLPSTEAGLGPEPGSLFSKSGLLSCYNSRAGGRSLESHRVRESGPTASVWRGRTVSPSCNERDTFPCAWCDWPGRRELPVFFKSGWFCWKLSTSKGM